MTERTMVNLGDVARRAGVSTASVSRVLNHPQRVSANIRERVLRAMEELGYVRDGAARALASRRSYAIGNVVPTLGISIFASGVESLQCHLEQAGYDLLVAASGYDPEKELKQVRAMIERGVDGIALVGHMHLPETYRLLESRGIPYLNTYEFNRTNPYPCIGFDNRKAAYQLTRYLVELGHRAFGVATISPAHNDRIASRLAGITDCLRDHGITLPPTHIMDVPHNIAYGRTAAHALLTEHPEITAICCTADSLAIGALFECRELGIRVPEEVSVTGFDDLEIVSHLDPGLTTAHAPADWIGERVAEFLLCRIQGKPCPKKTELQANVIIRKSTGVAPAKGRRRPRMRRVG